MNVYWTFFLNDTSVKLRYIVCPGCVEEMATDWLGKALHRGEDGRWHDPDDGETLESLLRAPERPAEHISWRKVS